MDLMAGCCVIWLLVPVARPWRLICLALAFAAPNAGAGSLSLRIIVSRRIPGMALPARNVGPV